MTDTALKKILVVDDSKDFVEMCSLRLKQMGYSVFAACSAREAVAAVRKENPDLILLDHYLPVTNGISLLEMMKSFGDLMLKPFIIITGDSAEELKEKALRAGAADIMIKPFGEKELREKIEKALEKK